MATQDTVALSAVRGSEESREAGWRFFLWWMLVMR
jgi:hypothetical protein